MTRLRKTPSANSSAYQPAASSPHDMSYYHHHGRVPSLADAYYDQVPGAHPSPVPGSSHGSHGSHGNSGLVSVEAAVAVAGGVAVATSHHHQPNTATYQDPFAVGLPITMAPMGPAMTTTVASASTAAVASPLSPSSLAMSAGGYTQSPSHPHAYGYSYHPQAAADAAAAVAAAAATAAANAPSSTHHISRPSSGAWTPQDDDALLQARARGENWSTIHQLFPGKTANACRKRHERLMDRRHVDDFDNRKMENIAREYISMRREIWQGLAQRTGEKWTIIEQKCLSSGLKNLQSAARAAVRRQRLEATQNARRGLAGVGAGVGGVGYPPGAAMGGVAVQPYGVGRDYSYGPNDYGEEDAEADVVDEEDDDDEEEEDEEDEAVAGSYAVQKDHGGAGSDEHDQSGSSPTGSGRSRSTRSSSSGGHRSRRSSMQQPLGPSQPYGNGHSNGHGNGHGSGHGNAHVSSSRTARASGHHRQRSSRHVSSSSSASSTRGVSRSHRHSQSFGSGNQQLLSVPPPLLPPPLTVPAPAASSSSRHRQHNAGQVSMAPAVQDVLSSPTEAAYQSYYSTSASAAHGSGSGSGYSPHSLRSLSNGYMSAQHGLPAADMGISSLLDPRSARESLQ